MNEFARCRTPAMSVTTLACAKPTSTAASITSSCPPPILDVSSAATLLNATRALDQRGTFAVAFARPIHAVRNERALGASERERERRRVARSSPVHVDAAPDQILHDVRMRVERGPAE